MTPDPISVHADLGADVETWAIAVAEQIEQLHLALVVRALESPQQEDEPRHSPVEERCRRVHQPAISRVIGIAPVISSQPLRSQNSRPEGLSPATRMMARLRPACFRPRRQSSISSFPTPLPRSVGATARW